MVGSAAVEMAVLQRWWEGRGGEAAGGEAVKCIVECL